MDFGGIGCLQFLPHGLLTEEFARKDDLTEQGITAENLMHDCRLAFTSKNSAGRGYSTGSTYFIEPDDKPRFLLEDMAQKVFKYHTQKLEGCKVGQCGAEWWTQVIDSRDDIGWHWDRDYGKEEDGELVYPNMATVTYLSEGGGCTTVAKVEGQTAIGETFDSQGNAVEQVVLCKPKFGKHLYFDGRYLHGAPADFDGDQEGEDESGGGSEEEGEGEGEDVAAPVRITFLVNVWLDNIPEQSTPFPDILAPKMKMGPKMSVESWRELPADKTTTVIVGETQGGSPTKWTFSDCSRRYSVSLPFRNSEPLKAFAFGESEGQLLRVDLRQSPGQLLDLGHVAGGDGAQSSDFEGDDVPQLKKARGEGLKVSIATTAACSVEDLAEIVNRAYDVEKGREGVAFKKAGIDRISDPKSLTKDVEAGKFLILKDGAGELLATIGWDMAGERCSFGPFAAKYKGKGHGKLLLGELEKLARRQGMNYLTLVVVNHRTELVGLYERLGFALTGEESPYPNPDVLSRPSHFVHMSKKL